MAVFLLFGYATLLVILAIGMISMFALTHAPDLHTLVNISVAMAMVTSIGWALFGWFLRLVTKRITKAPFPFQD